MSYKDEKMKKILSYYSDRINGVQDLIGDDPPAILFYLLGEKFSYLMDDDPEVVISERGVEARRHFNKVIKLFGPLFLSSKQVIENRNILRNPDSQIEDHEIVLPDDPVIWTPNHGFKDDALATVLAIPRNAYFLFGSLPQFYNTMDGVLAWANGSILINRKNAHSRSTSIPKCEKVIDMGADLIIYPEGVWNKSPNLLLLKLWPGAVRIAKEKGIKIVPIIHYKRELHLTDKRDYIHTVIDDPVDVSNMTDKEALEYLRDVYAYWLYLMMERYGKSTREKEVSGFENSTLAWEDKLRQRISTAARYDFEMETSADYVDKVDLEILAAWSDIANIQNITPQNISMVADAKQKVKTLHENNFQRRF